MNAWRAIFLAGSISCVALRALALDLHVIAGGGIAGDARIQDVDLQAFFPQNLLEPRREGRTERQPVTGAQRVAQDRKLDRRLRLARRAG